MDSVTNLRELGILSLPVHSFSWCMCSDGEFPVHHVKVRTWIQPIISGQAIALTYGIGDFGREKHLFGHVDDSLSMQQVRLEFGAEWDIQQIMKALIDLSETHDAIWMDQLSIPQEPVSIAFNLQNIPQIYRTLDVVILLPDALCSCLREVVEAYDTGNSSYTNANGDLDLDLVVGSCLNAFPVSSYHFRLWTKQEFTYARAISIRYCGLPVSSCSSGVRDWIHHASKDLLSEPGHLSPWCQWQYSRCVEETRKLDDRSGEMAYSTFRQVQTTGRSHLFVAVVSFYVRKDGISSQLDEVHKVAKFILGAELRRMKNDTEAVPIFENLHSEHVATEPQDLALAVWPSVNGYRLPEKWRNMSLPELVDNGLDQYERTQGKRCQTRLPSGLFGPCPGSMRCIPSLYLDGKDFGNLEDVYGPLYTLPYPALPGFDDHVMLHLRNGVRGRPGNRLSQAKTYSTSFGNRSTAQSLDFIRKVRKHDFGIFGKFPFGALAGWADRLLFDGHAGSISSWPSLAHEKAMFKQSLLHKKDWNSWPEIDHEKVCFELMCDFVCIDPLVARKKKLGLVVKTDDPPCIGFVNGTVYEAMRKLENGHKGRAADAIRDLKKVDDYLTIVTGATASSRQTRFVTLEAMRLDSLFQPTEIDKQARDEALPMYHVVGVWFFSAKDDSCIGAELAESWNTCDAVLV